MSGEIALVGGEKDVKDDMKLRCGFLLPLETRMFPPMRDTEIKRDPEPPKTTIPLTLHNPKPLSTVLHNMKYGRSLEQFSMNSHLQVQEPPTSHLPNFLLLFYCNNR